MTHDLLISSAVGISAALATYLLRRKQSQNTHTSTGVAVFSKHGINHGFVTIVQIAPGVCEVRCNLRALPAGYHGLHVHEHGDLRDGCASAGAHFNPYNAPHGGPIGSERHKGDFGNVYILDDGTCADRIVTHVNLHSIIGRTLMIHEGKDDLGASANSESLKTGNAGHRMLCSVIGRLDD